jgi:hypothetical protein
LSGFDVQRGVGHPPVVVALTSTTRASLPSRSSLSITSLTVATLVLRVLATSVVEKSKRLENHRTTPPILATSEAESGADPAPYVASRRPLS